MPPLSGVHVSSLIIHGGGFFLSASILKANDLNSDWLVCPPPSGSLLYTLASRSKAEPPPLLDETQRMGEGRTDMLPPTLKKIKYENKNIEAKHFPTLD